MNSILDFDFELPENLIANQPLEDRSASRMMVVERAAAQFRDGFFAELPDMLSPDDLVAGPRASYRALHHALRRTDPMRRSLHAVAFLALAAALSLALTPLPGVAQTKAQTKGWGERRSYSLPGGTVKPGVAGLAARVGHTGRALP